MEAGLTLPAWVGAEGVETGGCCGGIPNEQEAPAQLLCPVPDRKEKGSEEEAQVYKGCSSASPHSFRH